ncbi:MAG TPA: GtrA family protein [Anaerolineales bacterium]
MNLLTAARFLLVGMLGTLVDFSLFALLHTPLGMPTLFANSLSYSAGILNNYILHRRWTFAHRPQRAASKQFSQFMGVSLSALLINNLVVLLLTSSFSEQFAENAFGVYFAKVCAIGVGMIWNFLANHLWIFRAAPASDPPGTLTPLRP